jgi:hypothetical protein
MGHHDDTGSTGTQKIVCNWQKKREQGRSHNAARNVVIVLAVF